MMKKNILLLMALLWVACVSAQKYHDAAAFDLRGNVKECVVRQSNETKQGFYRFTSDGALSYCWGEEISAGSKLQRNADGYLSHLYLISMDYEYSYDTLNRILAEKYHMSSGIMDGFVGVWLYEYNAKGYIALKASTIFKNKGYSYEYTKFDSKGNWTERKVFDLETKAFKYKETRAIAYWTNAETPKESKDVFEVLSVKRLPKKFPLAKAKEGDLKQLILHPFGAKNLSAKCTSDELMSACQKMKLNAVSKINAFNGNAYGTVELTEKSQFTSVGLYGEDFKGVFCYKLFDAVVVAEAGFDVRNDMLFQWEYRLYPLKNSKISVYDIFEKAVKALAQSGLNVKLKSSKDAPIKYYIYEVEGVGLQDITLSTSGWCATIRISPAF